MNNKPGKVKSASAEWQQLVQRYSHPNYWFNRSSDLHASARAIWKSMHSPTDEADQLELGRGFSMAIAGYHVYHMLCGLALETAFKALLAQSDKWSPNDGTHSLVRLAEKLGMQLTQDERLLLEFYAASVIWAGRYPLPSKPTDEKLLDYWSLSQSVLTVPSSPVEGTTLQFRTASQATDWENFHILWRSLVDQFRHD